MILWCGERAAHQAHGPCKGMPGEGVRPTPEQWLGRIRIEVDRRAVRMATVVLEQADSGLDCFTGNHVAEIERLRAELRVARGRITQLESTAAMVQDPHV